MKSKFLYAGACILLALIGATAISRQLKKRNSLEKAPDFGLETLARDRFYLNQQRGKTVILVFGDTACSICKQEMVDLQELKEKHDKDKLTIAAICCDQEIIFPQAGKNAARDIENPVSKDYCSQ